MKKKRIELGRGLGGETTRVTQSAIPEPLGPSNASLVQIYGPSLGDRYVIDQVSLTIGRDKSNDVVIDSDNVSRAHARVLQEEGEIIFEDLGSTNGSLINDAESRYCVLQHGDLIKIGSVMLKFISSGNPEAHYHEEIYRMTIQDGLTGIANRRYFTDFLEREVARAIRYERPLTLTMFDIDHFKKINDHYGHLAGDYVLRRMATQVRGRIRREELFARYGGEEFAIVQPETGIRRAHLFGEKLRGLIAKTPFEFDGAEIPVSVSVGIAQLIDEANLSEFIKAADTALYQAKADGRNCVRVTA